MDAASTLKPTVGLEVRRTLTLALPLILAQVAQMSASFVDTLMVGRLGNTQLAGIALGGSIFFLTFLVCGGVLFSVSPVVSQAFGAGETRAAGRAAQGGFFLALLLSVPALVLFSQIGHILPLLGQEPEAVRLATGYVQAIAWGFVPALLTVSLRGLFEGTSNPRPVMVIAFLAVGFNALMNYLLMFGHWGFPALGLIGTGYASALSFWLSLTLLALYSARTLPKFGVFRFRGVDLGMVVTLLRIGWPIGLTLGFEAGLFSATAVLMGTLGTVPLAAHQIAVQSASFTFMVPLGLASATAVRVGQAVGRRDPDGIRWAGWVGIGLSACVMLVSALTFWFLPERVAGLYLDVADPANTAVVRKAVQFLAFAAVFQVFDGLQVSAAGALRGLKDTRAPMLISLTSYWGVGLSSGVLLAFVLGLGGRGLWLGLVLGLVTAAVLLVRRFSQAVPATSGGDGALTRTLEA